MNAQTTVEQAHARTERFQTENKWDLLLKQERALKDKERHELVKQGLITEKLNLEDAVAMLGTCQDMCPALERIERKIQRQLDPLEMVPGTTDPDPARCVKMFHRPTATLENLPSDVRPPHILLKTLDYLFHVVLPSGNELDTVHLFLRDRTRSIRQDFAIQHTQDAGTIECHERIARFHILALHEMRSMPDQDQDVQSEGYSEQQEIEQLNKTLTSLMHHYDDARHASLQCRNEPEFRAYNLLLHINNSDVIRQTELLPLEVLSNPTLKLSIQLCTLVQRASLSAERPLSSASPHFFTRFFKLIRTPSTSFLMACILEHHFAEIRKAALLTMANSFLPTTKTPSMPFRDIREMLQFDSDSEVQEFAVDTCGLEVDSIGIKLNRKVDANPTPKGGHQVRNKSTCLVVSKRGSTPFRDLVDGKAIISGLPFANPHYTPKPSEEAQSTPPRHVVPTHTSIAFPSHGLFSSFQPPVSKPTTSSRFGLIPQKLVAPTPQNTLPPPRTIDRPLLDQPVIDHKSESKLSHAFHKLIPPHQPNHSRPTSSVVSYAKTVDLPPVSTLKDSSVPSVPMLEPTRPEHLNKNVDGAARREAEIKVRLQAKAAFKRHRQTKLIAEMFTGEWVSGLLRPIVYEILAAEFRDRHVIQRQIRRLSQRLKQLHEVHMARQEKAQRMARVAASIDAVQHPLYEEAAWESSSMENQGSSVKPKALDQAILVETIERTTMKTVLKYARGVFLDCVRQRVASSPGVWASDWGIWIVLPSMYTDEETRLVRKFTTRSDDELTPHGHSIFRRSLGNTPGQFPGLIVYLISPDSPESTRQSELRRLESALKQIPIENPYLPSLLVLSGDLTTRTAFGEKALFDQIRGCLTDSKCPIQHISLVSVGQPDEHEQFERALSRVDLDVVGVLSPRTDLQSCINTFVGRWNVALDENLGPQQGVKLNDPARWLSYGRLLQHLIDVLNALYDGLAPLVRATSLHLPLDQRPVLKPLRFISAVDQWSLTEQLIEYLKGSNDLELVSLGNELWQSVTTSDDTFPARELADQLRCVVENKLWVLGDHVRGHRWKGVIERVGSMLQKDLTSLHATNHRSYPEAAGSASKRRRTSEMLAREELAKRVREDEELTPEPSYAMPSWENRGVAELEVAMSQAALIVQGLEN